MMSATGIFFFMQDKKAKNPVFLFLTSGFAVFFVSDSWYCQIQTPRQTNHVLLHIFDWGGGVYIGAKTSFIPFFTIKRLRLLIFSSSNSGSMLQVPSGIFFSSGSGSYNIGSFNKD